MSVFSFTSPLRCTGEVPAEIRGGVAWLRPLVRDEIEPLRTVFGAMSAESRYSRYLQAVSVLTPGMMRTLTAVDGTDHVAWLATVDGRPAGIGRYFREGPWTAEIAFEIADEFQGRGLGAALLDTLTTVAATSGIRALQAFVLGSNHASRHLLSRIGLRLLPQGAGVLEADGPFHLLEQPRVERPMVVHLALADWPLAA
jgi:GNAT superfamily N-acetyltransferase